ncbi:hypothetical protein DV738_g2076, partial [Chaetothyriales sp. CBS 135597]
MPLHLEIHAPSSTTISYTARSSKKPTSILVPAAKHALRIVLAYHVILLNVAKLQVSKAISADHSSQWLIRFLFRLTLLDSLVYSGATWLSWPLLIVLSSLALFLCIRRDYTEESLLVMRGLGIQASTSSPYCFLSATTTFIPATKIQDIVIHEAFKGLGVLFYLAVIVEGASEVVVVFPVHAITAS